jgi:Domain of unknown function (DUF6457)
MNELDAWITEMCAALGLDPSAVDRNMVLDLARDAAHGIARPAAPITTFLVGLAAGRDGADAAAIHNAAQIVTQLLTDSSSRAD